MEVSRRYAPHLLVVLALATVPVVRHTYLGHRTDPCETPDLLLSAPHTAGEPQEPHERYLTMASFDGRWHEERVELRGGGALRGRIVRSYDPKLLYNRPVLGIVEETRLEDRELEWVEAGGERLPVRHGRFERSDRPRRPVAAYLLAYHGRPVSNPYLAQLLAAPVEVVTGQRPMTLFIVSGRVAPPRHAQAEARATAWLASAWKRYRAVCLGEDSAGDAARREAG